MKICVLLCEDDTCDVRLEGRGRVWGQSYPLTGQAITDVTLMQVVVAGLIDTLGHENFYTTADLRNVRAMLPDVSDMGHVFPTTEGEGKR